MAEHRGSMLGDTLRRFEDPARSRDPRIREIVAALATVEPAPAPRAHFRAELRAQLVAVTPRLVAEAETEKLPVVPRHAVRPVVARTGGRAARRTDENGEPIGRRILSGVRLSRPLAAVAATVVVLGMLLGGAVLMSRGALPGDSLYSLKRASEDAQLALAPNAGARAKLKLDFASTRVDEVADLLPGGANAAGVASVSPHLAALVDTTLASANSDVISASQTLGEQAIQNNSAAPLQSMTGWAPGELTQLQQIMNRLPVSSPAYSNAQATYNLVSQAFTRATQLQAEAGCSCLHSAPSDQLGPIPCPVCTSPATPGTPNGTNGVVPGTTTTTPSTGASTSASDSGNGVGVTQTGSASIGPIGGPVGATPTGPGIPSLLPSGLPTLPSASVGPIGIGSCGVSISLSPINLHLGTCKPSHS